MLVALVLMAIPTAFRLAPDMIGKRFVDSYNFQNQMDGFYQNLSMTVLNPIQYDEAKDRLVVTPEEIEEHRTRYGSLWEQIQNIQEQYELQIQDAEEAGTERVKESLIKERDQKIDDIELNFESDDHVKEKIMAEKKKALKELIASIQQQTWTNFSVSYELTDVKTGETFSRGELIDSPLYERTFDEKKPFKARSIVGEGFYMEENYQEEAIGWEIADQVAELTRWSSTDESVALNEYVMDDHSEINTTTIQNPVRTFTGRVVVAEQALKESYLSRDLKQYNYQKYRNYAMWVAAFIALIILFTTLKFKKEWVVTNRLTAYYEALKIDFKVIVFVISLFIVVEGFLPAAMGRFFYDEVFRGAWWGQVSSLLLLTLGVIWLTVQLVLLIERWKVVGQFERDLIDSYSAKFLKAVRNMFLNRSIGVQMFILLMGFFLAGLGFAAIMVAPFLLLAYFPALLFLGLPALYLFVRRSAYLNEILMSTEKMAKGTLQEEIKVKGKSPFAKHAEHLNQLRQGVQISMNEQAKSERLKTELITNVSHDLRTPLTSIITYTDLLKTKDLSEDERLKYVEIIDAKSARLKTLIEDLFEVSKMASGNLELHKNRVDLTQLLKQALAEHEEEITNSSLDFRVQLPEQALFAQVDGQRWWRVLDNLIVNALKYSMAGTRVYVQLDQVGNRAQFVVKNISKYELSENSDELFERFKRADTSRHTDGSGLGLAIAQSIVDMHGGDMKIEIDGDLFKVTVEMPL